MPRKGRGGARKPTPGSAYANRTDLNTAAGGTAGSMVAPRSYTPGGKPEVSLPQGSESTPPPGSEPFPGLSPTGPLPGQVTGLSEASARPLEPITQGLNDPHGGELPYDPDERLRALYAAHPTEDIRRLLRDAV